MREILFRGKALTKYTMTKQENGWVFGVPVPIRWDGYMRQRIDMVECHGYDELDDYALLSEDDEVDPKSIGQYIGLLDKNGKKIFEGDIINGHNSVNDDFMIYRVVYEENGFYYCDEDGIAWYPERIENAEIIGNIYDNPELMEVE